MSSKSRKRERSKSRSRSRSPRRKKQRTGRPEGVQRVNKEDNYYSHNKEFVQWLLKKKHIRFTSLDKKESLKYFSKFCDRWNDGRLSAKYYDREGIETSNKSADRTEYRWKVSSEEARRVIQQVHSDSFKKDLLNFRDGHSLPTPVSTSESRYTNLLDPVRPPSSSSSSSYSSRHSIAERVLDQERRAEESQRDFRKERKKKERDQRDLMDELVPRETGREALIQKKKERAVERRQREDSPEHPESVTLGGGGSDDFKAALRREKQRYQKRDEKKAVRSVELEEKLKVHQAKEEQTMDYFRQLLAARQQQEASNPLPPPS